MEFCRYLGIREHQKGTSALHKRNSNSRNINIVGTLERNINISPFGENIPNGKSP